MKPVLHGLVVGVLLAAVPALAADAKSDAAALLLKAQAAESAQQFGKALECYLKCYLAGQQTEAIRERIHDCLRKVEQTRRLRDPAFKAYVLALPISDALNLYAEIVRKLSTHYADREQAKPERLYALSLQELERAVGDASFRKSYLPRATESQWTAFAKRLREEWPLRLPTSARESRAAMQELVRAAVGDLNVAEPTALVVEAICGACAGLDEATSYTPPVKDPKVDTEPTITRAEITDAMAGVGQIAIRKFAESTPAEFDNALQQLKMLGLRALVLDLRGNAGGSFTAAIRIAERLIPGGVLATTVGQLPEVDGRLFASTSGMAALDLPLVVLIDAKTMSAAEVLAAAIKEAGRGTLIGMTTFGKGTVQSAVPLDGDGPGVGRLMVTIARVLSPNGTPLHGSGVVPVIREPDAILQQQLATRRASELAMARGEDR